MDGGLVKIDGFVVGTIVLYVSVIMGVGWFASRRVANLTDFLVAGRKLPMWMATATLLATWFGAGSSMGVAGTVYSSGIYGVVADPFGASISLIIAGIFYVTHLRRLRLLTVTDIIERSYGKAAGAYASFWMLPVYIGWLGVQIMGIGKILHLLFNVDELTGALIGAGIVLFYTLAGGMWAVTLTDVLQVALIITGLAVILPGAIGACGGIETLLERIPAADLSLLPPERDATTWVSYCGQWVVMGLGCIVGQDLIQRSLAAKNPVIAGRSAIFAGIGYLMICFIPITIGFCGRYILEWNMDPRFFTDGVLSDPEQVIPLMAVRVLPSWLLALFLSALVSAIMSSADSSLLAASSLITNNIVRPYCPRLSDRKLLGLTRILTLLVLALSLLLALNVERMFSLLVNSWATQLLVIFIPVTTALYWRRIGKVAAWTGMIVAPLVWIVYSGIQAEWTIANLEDNLLYCGALYGFLAGIVVTVLAGIFYPRKPGETWRLKGSDGRLTPEQVTAGDNLPPPPILS